MTLLSGDVKDKISSSVFVIVCFFPPISTVMDVLIGLLDIQSCKSRRVLMADSLVVPKTKDIFLIAGLLVFFAKI